MHLLGTNVTDADLVHLIKGMTSMERLSLSDTQVTDEGLAHLAGMTSMWIVELGRTQVTDDGVEKLKTPLPTVVVIR